MVVVVVVIIIVVVFVAAAAAVFMIQSIYCARHGLIIDHFIC